MKELVEGIGLNALALLAPPPLKIALAVGYLSYKFVKNGEVSAGEVLAAGTVLASGGIIKASPLLKDPKLARCVESLFMETDSYKKLVEATRALKAMKDTGKSAELIMKTQAYQNWLGALRAFEREAGRMLQSKSCLERALRANPIFNSLSKADQQRLLTSLFDDEVALIRALDVAQSNLKKEIAENAPKAIQRQMNKEVDETFKRLRKKAKRKRRKNENKRDSEENNRKRESVYRGDEHKLKKDAKTGDTGKNSDKKHQPVKFNQPVHGKVSEYRLEGAKKKELEIGSFYVRRNNQVGKNNTHYRKGVKETAFGQIDDVEELGKAA